MTPCQELKDSKFSPFLHNASDNYGAPSVLPYNLTLGCVFKDCQEEAPGEQTVWSKAHTVAAL